MGAFNSLKMVAGDVGPVPLAYLQDALGNPLNLDGAVLRFRMVNYHTGEVGVDGQAESLQITENPDTWGQVTYYWQPEDTQNPGLYLAYFIADFGNGPQHFPADDSYFVLIRAAH